jgi:fatty acid kinase/fatty acid kinase fatty acid binding subunit
MQIRYVDGPRLKRSLVAACDHTQHQRAELNRINVFPVPDGDTGTNLALTVRAVADHLRTNTDRSVSAVAHEAAQGAVLGARGNSGMMLSHFLLGFADSVSGHDRITVAEFSDALTTGVERLYDSLEDPVEGTILTVMRDTATAAQDSDVSDFVPLVSHVVAQARDSLARTPEQLEVLKKAGVVDAGAKGFVSMLEGVLYFVEGVSLAAEAGTGAPGSSEANGIGAEADEGGAGSDGPAAAGLVEYSASEEQYQFCTEALVRGAELPEQKAAREVLREFGDSLIVIRSEDVLKIHIHTDDPEEVFDYLRSVGSLVTHKAEDMRVQHDAIGSGSGHIQLARRPVAVVTDSACDLSEEIVRAHGINVVPLSLVDGDATYLDGVDMSATDFHELLASAETLPTTSQPTPAAILDSLRQAAEEGESVVAVFLSSTLSGTVGAAEVATARFDDASVDVVDSLGASLLQGLLALKAAELAEVGRAPDAIVRELERIRARSGILFTVRTFERLMASGRVGRGKAAVGGFLGVKPIMGMTPDGSVVTFARAFGEARARDRMLAVLRRQIPKGAEQVRFGVVHVGLPEIVEEMTRRLRSEYGDRVEILSAPATPVISTHLGIGAWGIAFLVED